LLEETGKAILFSNQLKQIELRKKQKPKFLKNAPKGIIENVEPVYERHLRCNLSTPITGLSRTQDLSMRNGEIWNLETSADVFIRRIYWNVQCDILVPFHEKQRKAASKCMDLP
jgi:hypothetical protein